MTKKIVKRTDANNEILYFYTHSDAVDVGEGNATISLTNALNSKASASDLQALSNTVNTKASASDLNSLNNVVLKKTEQALTQAEKDQVHNNLDSDDFLDERAVRYDEYQVLGPEERELALVNLGLNGVDAEPTKNSQKMVRSGGVAGAIDNVQYARFDGIQETSVTLNTTTTATADGTVLFYVPNNVFIYKVGSTYYTLWNNTNRLTNGFYNDSESTSHALTTKIFINTGDGLPYSFDGTDFTTVAIDDEPTPNSDNLVKSGGVKNELVLGAVYDVSAKNPTAGSNNDGKFESLSALLSDANINTLIPIAVRKGGMSIKFVQTSDNKYVQYRLMKNTWSTTVSDWQGVDDEPVAGSENLVKSGGVYKELDELNIKIQGGYKLNVINVDDYEKIYAYVANNAKWASSSTGYGVFVPVNPGQRIFITKGTRSAFWSPLKTTSHTPGTTPTFASGYDNRVQVVEDSVIILPDDAKYLFIDVKISSGIVTDEYKKEDIVDGLTSITDRLEEKISDLDDITSYETFVDKTSQMVNNYYVNTNVNEESIVDVENPISNNEYSYIIFQVTSGQKIKVRGSGGVNSRLWAFTGLSYNLLSKSDANLKASEYIELTAPSNGFIIFNASRTSVSYPRGILISEIETIDKSIESLNARVSSVESQSSNQNSAISSIDDELFNIDSHDWVFSEKKAVRTSTTTDYLSYLGKCNCNFKIESSSDNYFELRGTNQATGGAITLKIFKNEQASFPIEFPNPRPDLELTNIRIVGISSTIPADFTLTITKVNPIKPLIDATYADKCMADMLISNFKSTAKFSDSDYEEMKTSDIYDAYDALVAAYPNYISKTEIGEVESEEIGTIPAETNKIIRYDFNPTWAANTEAARKIKIMILTGTHPEYMAIRALLKIMTSICELWESSEALEFLRFNVHFVIIPCASPWAVNHHSRVNANGVDMARNYQVGWTQGTYVTPPSSTSTYGGSEPLSETESQLVNSVFESEKEDLIAAIDFHNHFSSSSLFWVARNAGDAFMTGVAGNFLKMIPRQETKYDFITPYTALGTTDETNPGGSFGRNANGNGIKGLTFETSGVVVSELGFSNLGEVLTVSHDGFINFLLTLLRELQLRQYSIKI